VGATVDLFPGSQLFRRAKSSSPKTSRSFSRADAASEAARRSTGCVGSCPS